MQNTQASQITKNQLRSEILKKVSALPIERKTDANIDACHFLLQKLLHDPQTLVLSFASMPFELSLWALNKWLADNKRLLLPRLENDTIQVYKVTNWKQLYISSKNIQEPNPFQCEKISFDQIAYALIPAVSFDHQKHRLGYGKGHYDRFLPKISQAKKWGVGFKEQSVPALPIEAHDFKLDEVFLF